MHQLLDDLRLPLMGSPAEGTAHAVLLMERYVAVQPMYEGLDDRERGPADELPVLAAGEWGCLQLYKSKHLMHACTQTLFA